MLDIDGCVSAWLKAACDACGLDINDPKIRKPLKDGKLLHDVANISEEDMWDKINANGIKFWSELELLPWAKELYNRTSKLADVCFLTSPGRLTKSAAYAAAGKILWVDKHFATTKILIGYNKEFCASKNTILVDDSDSKINKFLEHGGNVFRWPNDLKLLDKEVDLEETLKRLEEAIVALK